VVCPELSLDSLGGVEALHDGQPGIVDEDVEFGGELRDLGRDGADGGLRGEVEGEGLDANGWVGFVEGGYDGREVGGCAGGEDEEGGGLGGDGGGGCGADAVGAYARDEDWILLVRVLFILSFFFSVFICWFIGAWGDETGFAFDLVGIGFGDVEAGGFDVEFGVSGHGCGDGDGDGDDGGDET